MTEDEEIIETTTSSAGERLQAAREEKGLSLEDLAAQTRIPLRHLQSLEQGDWSRLPAPTYTIGFAKSYASAVGLDRTDIGDDLRTEMGGQRFDTGSPEVFEPVDPARTMPKWLVFSAIGDCSLSVTGSAAKAEPADRETRAAQAARIWSFTRALQRIGECRRTRI